MLRFPVLLALAIICMPSAAKAAYYAGLQCVPYARALTGVEIRGDAHSWWGQAKGRYQRGSKPRVGAVMSFRPHGGMRLGHVAAVRQIIDNRTIIISHANWSTIGGRRGHVEENVKVVDASDNNDWSRVRVWYTPNNALGGTRWPINGFIYPKKRLGEEQMKARLTALLGNRARFTPLQGKYRGGEVRMARASKPRRKAGTFRLSSNVMSDIERNAAREERSVRSQPKGDPIGEIIASLGN